MENKKVQNDAPRHSVTIKSSKEDIAPKNSSSNS